MSDVHEMNRNVEIKARVDSLAPIRDRVKALADEGPLVLEQEDTFFPTARGRLKLRRTAPDSGELVFYERTDAAGPKLSAYRLVRTDDPSTLCDVLSTAFGNVAESMQTYAFGRYRLNLPAFWSRLQPLLQQQWQELLEL